MTQCVVLHPDLRPCGDRPLLAWLMRELIRYGVTEFLLPADSLASEYGIAGLQARLPRPVHITSVEPTANAGILFNAGDQLEDRFLVCGGLSVPESNLGNLLARASAEEPDAAGRILADGDVRLFDKASVERARLDGPPGAAAWLTLTRQDFVSWPTLNPQRVRPSAVIADRLRRRALFLDRDGVLNLDHGYVGSRERFEWIDGALDAIRFATEAGWHVFIVTNQSGVARGLYTEEAVRELLDWISDQARGAGGTVDDTRFCPFHLNAVLAAYRQDHPWRKPLPGMLLDLIAKWEVDPARAVMIGDQESDMHAAAAAGVEGALFLGGNILSFVRRIVAERA